MAKKDETETEDVGAATFEGGDGSVTVDMSNVEAASFEVLPAGKYNGIIEKNEYKLSQSSGKPMWAMTINVTDHPDYEGRKIFNNLSFSEKALPFTKKTLLGLAPEFTSGEFNPEEEAHKLVGKEVVFKLSIRKDQNNDDQNNVKDIRLRTGDDGGAFFSE